MTSLNDLKAKMLADPEVKAEYDRLAPEFEIAETLIRARQRAGLSQAEVAKRMGTTQSVVARLESGRSLPSSTSLARYAAATGSRLRVELLPGR
ncbi:MULTISPECIES: helix-turn-helix domain-containing protein [Rhodospirillales]|jgi:ribosome-binding protein aMBF1 (putative translation factor)|uniref:Transcriptional regulator n=1 Tax=Paramagnetospirillum caucaseum TaxID=1244869 RepID=M2ZM26_9PROT|nr:MULTISPECIES: helix-turn-helix transcriptional regulator [Rhodospirillales]EME68337.1 transcriptional regulator [Paramagnetospirillum caucaseum]MBF0423666.1 helix-turn-helix transcriptional regulator [Magnetococcales bacterium]